MSGSFFSEKNLKKTFQVSANGAIKMLADEKDKRRKEHLIDAET